MPRIIFLPEKKSVQIGAEATLLDAARGAGIPINSSCGGKQKCGKCVVLIKEGIEGLPAPGPEEAALLFKKGWGPSHRLACATKVSCDLVVEAPDKGLGKERILTKAQLPFKPKKIKPVIETYRVEVPLPSLSCQADDQTRLNTALKDAFGLKGLEADPFVLRDLPKAIRRESGKVAVLVRDKGEIIKLLPGSASPPFGAAIDLGTTTVVCYLLDLKSGEELFTSSSINPQIKFGEDIISRISYCVQKPWTGLKELQKEVVDCINRLLEQVTTKIGASPGEAVEMVVVGNTAMHHLFLGLDPQHLSLAPYVPVVSDALNVKARELGINISGSAYVHLPPLKAGFLGSDAIAGLIATGLYRMKSPTLLIDLGTNGELVLGNRDKLMGCSTAAGPAFEGGHITWGMRAAPGAIERVRLESSGVTLETIGGRKPAGICGSGLISAAAELLRLGLLLPKGNFNDSSGHPNFRKGAEGIEFLISPAPDNAVGRDIVITQKDISELQMAKAAIWAGAKVLSEITGLSPRRVLLAGAGGRFIDPEDARTIGLFPFDEQTEIRPVGNAAGRGAALLLVDRGYRKRAMKMAKKMDYFELSGSRAFQDFFVQGMFFTGATDYSADF